MKKTDLKRRINDLKKCLTSDNAHKALGVLVEELENYQEPEVKEAELVLPSEINRDAVGLFSDGACRGNPGPGAYAYIVQDGSGAVVLEGADVSVSTTNNKMELQGVIKGLQAIKASAQSRKQIFVYTDSKYVVNGITSWVAGWKRRGWKKADNKAPENLELWQELDSEVQSLNVSFHWVKGHAGHPQNEKVDKMANILLDENGY